MNYPAAYATAKLSFKELFSPSLFPLTPSGVPGYKPATFGSLCISDLRSRPLIKTQDLSDVMVRIYGRLTYHYAGSCSNGWLLLGDALYSCVGST